MKNRGFTLVELLAVIVVLGIILVIAIPSVVNIINKVRIDTYIKSEEMMIKASRNYLINNSTLLPSNIGDTIEIKLDDLKSNKLIDDIKDPRTNNSCNGYILVTKLGVNEYDYSPNLNCVNNIGSVATDGLIGYWKLDNNAIDYSLSNYQGTINNVNPGANRFGINNKAMQFGGSNNYIIGSSNLNIVGDATFTMCAWIKWLGGSWSADYPSFIGNNSTGITNTGLSFTIKDGRPAIDFWINRYRATNPLNINTWYFIVGVKTPGLIGNTSKIYINGTLVNGALEGTNVSPNITSTPFVIGRLDNTRYFNGLIDDVRIYNRALTENEIKYIYDLEKNKDR